MSDLLSKIQVLADRAAQLEAKLAEPGVAANPAEFARLAKELAGLLADLEGAQAMLAEGDAELSELARSEVADLEPKRAELEKQIKLLLVPRDANDERNAILEIRAGTGGTEAALFAYDLFRMYGRYAERRGWKVEPLSLSESEAGGVKEVIAAVSGEQVFHRLKHERGVHRVQRVPATESQGRIHTSTVTVAVLPEAEEVDIQINPADLRIDVFRSSGPGGQSVNTTDSAVRVTHLPTGVVVQCQDEKSQLKNKTKAMKVLRARLLEAEQERAAGERASERRSQVGTGGRSEKIRTYNFPQSRITDHRAGVTVHQLETVLQGDLDDLLDQVHTQINAS
jgi:peptide chain release factor 1